MWTEVQEAVARITAKADLVIALQPQSQAIVRALERLLGLLCGSQSSDSSENDAAVAAAAEEGASICGILGRIENFFTTCTERPLVAACIAHKLIEQLIQCTDELNTCVKRLSTHNLVSETDSGLAVEDLSETIEGQLLRAELTDLLRSGDDAASDRLLDLLRRDGIATTHDAIRIFAGDVDRLHRGQSNGRIDAASSSASTTEVDIALLEVTRGPPSYFLCPLTHQMMQSPSIVLDTGVSYDKEALSAFAHQHGVDPLTYIIRSGSREPQCKKLRTFPNQSLLLAMQRWKQRMAARATLPASQSNLERESPSSSPPASPPTTNRPLPSMTSTLELKADAHLRSLFIKQEQVQWDAVARKISALIVLTPHLTKELEAAVASQPKQDWILSRRCLGNSSASCLVTADYAHVILLLPYPLLAGGLSFDCLRLRHVLDMKTARLDTLYLPLAIPSSFVFAPWGEVNEVLHKLFLEQCIQIVEDLGGKAVTFQGKHTFWKQVWKHPLHGRPNPSPSQDLANEAPWSQIISQRRNGASSLADHACSLSSWRAAAGSGRGTVKEQSRLSWTSFAALAPQLHALCPCLLPGWDGEPSRSSSSPLPMTSYDDDWAVSLDFFSQTEYCDHIQSHILAKWTGREFLGYGERYFPEIIEHAEIAVLAMPPILMSPNFLSRPTIQSLMTKRPADDVFIDHIIDQMRPITISTRIYLGKIPAMPAMKNAWKGRLEIEAAWKNNLIELPERFLAFPDMEAWMTATKPAPTRTQSVAKKSSWRKSSISAPAPSSPTPSSSTPSSASFVQTSARFPPTPPSSGLSGSGPGSLSSQEAGGASSPVNSALSPASNSLSSPTSSFQFPASLRRSRRSGLGSGYLSPGEERNHATASADPGMGSERPTSILSGGAMKASETLFKHLFVGDSGVGKTSLLTRLIHDDFTSTFRATIGIDCQTLIDEQFGQRVKQQLWDTSGQERFHTVTTSYFRNAMSIFVVYDVTNRASFEGVMNWLQQIQRLVDHPVTITLVGNKCDCDEAQRATTWDEGRQLAKTMDCLFVEVSAKKDNNVAMMVQMATSIMMLNLCNWSDERLGKAVDAWFETDRDSKLNLQSTVKDIKTRRRWCTIL